MAETWIFERFDNLIIIVMNSTSICSNNHYWHEVMQKNISKLRARTSGNLELVRPHLATSKINRCLHVEAPTTCSVGPGLHQGYLLWSI